MKNDSKKGHKIKISTKNFIFFNMIHIFFMSNGFSMGKLYIDSVCTLFVDILER